MATVTDVFCDHPSLLLTLINCDSECIKQHGGISAVCKLSSSSSPSGCDFLLLKEGEGGGRREGGKEGGRGETGMGK